MGGVLTSTKKKRKTSARRLTAKQCAFIDAYTGSAFGNATKAARKAGYKGTDAVLRSIASENLTKPNIQAVIKERLDKVAMTEAEILYRLGRLARADKADYIEIVDDDEDGPGWRYDVEGARERGLLHAVKRLGVDRNGRTTLELYDQESALVRLGQYHGMWVDKKEIGLAKGQTGKITIQIGGKPDDAAPGVVDE